MSYRLNLNTLETTMNKIMQKTYNYFFLFIYKLINVFDDNPSFATIMVLCWIFLLNSVSLVSYLIYFLELKIIYIFDYLILYSLMVLIFHFYYFNNRRRNQIVNEVFNNKKKIPIYLGTVVFFIYIILSNWLFFKYTIQILETIR